MDGMMKTNCNDMTIPKYQCCAGALLSPSSSLHFTTRAGNASNFHAKPRDRPRPHLHLSIKHHHHHLSPLACLRFISVLYDRIRLVLILAFHVPSCSIVTKVSFRLIYTSHKQQANHRSLNVAQVWRCDGLVSSKKCSIAPSFFT
jgi:hypothetical protein